MSENLTSFCLISLTIVKLYEAGLGKECEEWIVYGDKMSKVYRFLFMFGGEEESDEEIG